MLEHLRLCSRISYAARHLDAITDTVLTIIDGESEDAVDAYRDAKKHAKDKNLDHSRFSIGARIAASPPCQAAVLIFQEIGIFTRDSAEGINIVRYWLNFMQKDPHRWHGSAALVVGLGILRDACREEHHQFMLASTLVRHLAWQYSQKGESRQELLKEIYSQASYLRPPAVAALLLLLIQLMGPLITNQDIFDAESNNSCQSMACFALPGC